MIRRRDRRQRRVEVRGLLRRHRHALIETAPKRRRLIGELFARDGAVWGRSMDRLGASAITGKTYRGLSPIFLHDSAGVVVAFITYRPHQQAKPHLPALNEAGGASTRRSSLP